MLIVKCVILSFILMVGPPPCSPSPVLQQNPTALPVNTVYIADVSVERCGDPENNAGVQQAQKSPRSFPGSRAPLDPLSISPVKPKRNRPRRIKPSQKCRLASGALNQAKVSHSGSLTAVRPVDSSSSTGQTEKSTSTNQQRLDPTKASGTTDRTPSDHSRTRSFSSRTGFGVPIDRIGLKRLPSGRRYF